jgi:hypothetical protein
MSNFFSAVEAIRSVGSRPIALKSGEKTNVIFRQFLNGSK